MLKRMLTRYNFGGASDLEMLHMIYNAEPMAPFIEIPRRVKGNNEADCLLLS